MKNTQRVLLAAISVLATSAVSEASFSYVSATRFIEGSPGIPREDASGFSDFDVDRTGSGFSGQSGMLPVRVQARQRSILRPDRMEISVFSSTGYPSGGYFGNSMSSTSDARIQFMLSEPANIELRFGQLYSQTAGIGGGTGATWLLGDGSPLLPFAEANRTYIFPLQTGVLYDLRVYMTSGSLGNNSGSAAVDVVVLIPGPAAGVSMLAFGMLWGGRRRR